MLLTPPPPPPNPNQPDPTPTPRLGNSKYVIKQPAHALLILFPWPNPNSLLAPAH